MLLAHLLDSQYHGRSLARNGTTIIEKFIHQYYPRDSAIIWEQITLYRTQTGIFNITLAWNTIDKINPIAWWKGNFMQLASQLTKLAIRVLSIPSSSAVSERNWSAFSYIHDKKRNRLMANRVLKLVYIYNNYKLTLPCKESLDIAEVIARINTRESSDYEEELIEDLDVTTEPVDDIEANIEKDEESEENMEKSSEEENNFIDSESESEEEEAIESDD
jgi:hypothetical protein